MPNKDYMVSVCMITYNHEKYITQSLESVLGQKTNFQFEIVIGEDCSTDSTREIVLEYKEIYPNNIKLILQEKNIGMMQNFIDTLKACTGKYIAMLEGDDYWTASYKLQKQVDFLEVNPEYGLVYSDISLINENNNNIETITFEKIRARYNSGLVFGKLLEENFIPALTVVVRSALIFDYYKNFPDEWFMHDIRLWLHVAQKSKVYFLNEKTAAYRIHNNGISRSEGFFSKRSPLVQQSALLHYFSENENKDLEKKIIGKTLYGILFNKHLTMQEKQPTISLVFNKHPIFSLYILNTVLQKAWKKLSQN